MFMQRLITSLILAPLVLLALFYANPWGLGAAVLVVVLLAGREAWQLIPLHQLAYKVGFLGLLVVALWACTYLISYWLTVGLIAWVFIIVAVVTFPASQKYWGSPLVVAGVLLIVLPLFVQCLVQVYFLPQGKSLLVYLLFLIWSADIGAYLVGRLCGKHKLIPQVSPGKSWEGLVGGFVLAMAIAITGALYYVPYSLAIWFSLAAITVILSVFGDLFISILKRRCHLKDTGTIIPGHGGVLDRLDSLIAAMPVFYFGLTFMPLGV